MKHGTYPQSYVNMDGSNNVSDLDLLTAYAVDIFPSFEDLKQKTKHQWNTLFRKQDLWGMTGKCKKYPNKSKCLKISVMIYFEADRICCHAII